MAIYHYSVKAINRSSGRSSVAAAAYRSGEKLVDERTGNVFDYERRNGVVHAEVFLPDGTTMPRAELWNLAEAAEKRKDAKVAREIVVALPHELTAPEQLTLIREYAQGLSQRTGWAVDVAVHAPGEEGDHRNSHAHLLCTTRVIERSPDGVIRLGAKTREWDVVSSGKELIRSERQEWEAAMNQALELAQQAARVDARSYAEQGLELMPQTHLGVSACQMERKGIETERGNRNRLAADHNREVVDLAEKRAEREAAEALQKDLRRWKRMDVKALEAEAIKLAPGSARGIAYEDPTVQEAYKPLRSCGGHYEGFLWVQPEKKDYEAGKFGWLDERHVEKQEAALKQASTALVWAQRAETQWRQYHPYKSSLFDIGLPNRELKGLVQTRQAQEADESREKQKLAALLKAREQAQQKLEAAIQKVLPQAKIEHAKRKERYEALETVLKPKQEQEKQEREQQRQKERSQDRGGGLSIGW
jgi:MobA/MobL family